MQALVDCGSTVEMPILQNMVQAVRRNRAGSRPTNPNKDDKMFPIDETFIPANFLKRFIIFPNGNMGERHIIFGSEQMFHFLAICRTWFLDGTFKIVGDPFTQLFTISGFVKINGKI